MYKRSIIIVIATVLVIAAALVCVIPQFTNVDATLNATKINEQGEALGTHEIVLRGNRLDYLLTDAALEVAISPFDSLSGFVAEGKIKTATGKDICYVLYSASNAVTDDVAIIRICFSPEMDRWVFVNDTDQVYYVASVSGAYSTQELVEYFRPLIPSNWTTD